MKLTRALGVSAVAVSLVLTGCSTAVDGRAQQDSSTETVCDTGYVLTEIGKCVPEDEAVPTSPTPAAQPVPAALPPVVACDGTQCDLSTSSDEVDRLVAESMSDLEHMWANLNVELSVRMYKNGTVGCDVNDDPNATGWVCAKKGLGGWNPTALRARAAERGASIADTVRSVMAHEVGHIVIEKFGATHPDMMTNELRADCMAAGYSRWTVTTTDSAMEPLPLSRMKKALYGSESARALDAGYNGSPKTCTEYTR